MLKTLNHFAKNEILIAVLLFFLPFINFVSPTNIKQLDFNSFLVLFLFNFFFCISLLTILHLIKKYFLKKKITNFLIIISLFYFSLFYYNDIKIYLDAINSTISNDYQIINWRYYGELALLIIFIIIFFIFYLNYKIFLFKNILKTFVIFFISANLFLNLFFFSKYFLFTDINNNKKLDEYNLNLVKLNKPQNIDSKNMQNIYYILFDGMISLENALKQNIILDRKQILELKKKIKNLNLKYIPESRSNYNVSYLSIASIFYLNSPVNEKSPIYKNNNFFFPRMLNSKNKKILPIFLNHNNYNFYYFGNNWSRCINDYINNINCFGQSLNKKYINILESFYINTPIIPLIKIMFSYDDKSSSANFFLNNFKTVFNKININSNNLKNNFIFVHAMNPHPPYFDKNCNYNNSIKLTSYSYSYFCTLNNIINITNFLNEKDPSALIVFQSDHGWNSKIKNQDDLNEDIYSQKPIINGKLNKNAKNDIYFRSSIFNAIKAPEKCFNTNKTPKSNSNTVKFIFNCVFNYNLVYEDNNHYIGFYESNKNYGKVYKVK